VAPSKRITTPTPVGTGNLGNLLRNPWLELGRQVIERLHAAGYKDVRAAHAPVMQFIDDQGTRITELAERAQLTKATVVYLVNDLEALGYVERAADPADRRAKLVRPTARGRKMVDAARRGIAELTAEWAELIGERDLAELSSLLMRLNEALWPGWSHGREGAPLSGSRPAGSP
jgi:DNA-binding MarR family transcriptional regulator